MAVSNVYPTPHLPTARVQQQDRARKLSPYVETVTAPLLVEEAFAAISAQVAAKIPVVETAAKLLAKQLM
jgi:hypothetical protein